MESGIICTVADTLLNIGGEAIVSTKKVLFIFIVLKQRSLFLLALGGG